ncbi:hypothetical protein SETIT_7G023300v2 [Setaria italica]|uniref:Uncharacterized protein n=1 Tax=Setaria italica TaxID=4555 RepID=A0A368RT15_SETIT|nr:hypothetical protein SETIT_7G023300v2 [Setaria italica]
MEAIHPVETFLEEGDFHIISNHDEHGILPAAEAAVREEALLGEGAQRREPARRPAHGRRGGRGAQGLLRRVRRRGGEAVRCADELPPPAGVPGADGAGGGGVRLQPGRRDPNPLPGGRFPGHGRRARGPAPVAAAEYDERRQDERDGQGSVDRWVL